jgi:hypothetical protein
LEKHVASIFKVEGKAKKETSMKASGKQSIRLVSCLASSPLKMEVTCSSERLTFNGLHGITSQKIELSTTMRTPLFMNLQEKCEICL